MKNRPVFPVLAATTLPLTALLALPVATQGQGRSLPKKGALSSGPVAGELNAAVTVTVDAAANRHAINPLIYGSCLASAAQINDLNLPLNRYGGNNTSRYNWQLNADNRGSDWYFQSIGESNATPGARVNSFISDSKTNGAQPMVTIPMVGYVAKLGPNRSYLWSYSQSKYGAQTDADWQWNPDSGNGVRASDGVEITWNDPLDANVPADHNFQRNWVQQMISNWGTAANGGLRYYIYDNEHSIWHATHRDVHPVGATMEEVRNKIIAYGTMIRQLDPSSLLVGPEEWGWDGYRYSGYDLQYMSQNGWGEWPDKEAHGNMDYMPWLLQQLKAHEDQTGQSVLDVFSLHFYPQGGEYWSNNGNDVTTAMQQRRNRSTRALWDPAYVDETWIDTQVRLIPRMKEWVSTYYPGRKTAITEYNWAAESHINGATTQADIYGIFGREGLDMATRWTTPAASTPTYKAMKMYRNYDGQKNGFGETSIKTTSTANADNVAVFSSLRAKDGALTVMVVCKYLSDTTPVTVNLQNFAAGSAAKVWRLTSSNAITAQADVAISGNSLTMNVPQQSITLLVIPPAPLGLVKGANVAMEKWEGDATTINATVELRNPGQTTALESQSVRLYSPGALYFNTTRRGTFDIAIKGAPGLRKTLKNVTITDAGATLPVVTLLNGDADGSNSVTTIDMALVQKAMGARPGNPKWDACADVNGDGVVSRTDYNIVVANLRKSGDN